MSKSLLTVTIAPSTRKKVVRNLQKVQQDIIKSGNSALKEMVDKVYVLSQQNVSVDTGTLAASGQKSLSAQDGVLTGQVSYGDNKTNPRTGITSVNYALDVHESKDQENAANYKFLEKALIDNTADFHKLLVKAIKLRLG